MNSLNLDQLTRLALRTLDEDELLYPMVIKEILQVEILQAMVEADLFRKLVFKGGTALRLCHEGARYSEDLDFSAEISLEQTDIARLKTLLFKTVRERYGLEVDFREPRITLPQAPGSVRHWQARIQVPIPRRVDVRQTHIVHIDVAFLPAYDPVFLPTTTRHGWGEPSLVRVSSLNELLADKIVALGGRSDVKWRDVFDIGFLAGRHVQVNEEWLRHKFQDQNIAVRDVEWRALLQDRCEVLTKPDTLQRYQQEMSRFLLSHQARQWLRDEVATSTLLQVERLVRALLNV